jgi:hypothetical protein
MSVSDIDGCLVGGTYMYIHAHLYLKLYMHTIYIYIASIYMNTYVYTCLLRNYVNAWYWWMSSWLYVYTHFRLYLCNVCLNLCYVYMHKSSFINTCIFIYKYMNIYFWYEYIYICTVYKYEYFFFFLGASLDAASFAKIVKFKDQ